MRAVRLSAYQPWNDWAQVRTSIRSQDRRTEFARSWYFLSHPELRKTPRIAAFVDYLLEDTPAPREALIS
jgi:hypothetical protein